MDMSPEEIRSHIDKDIFRLISQIADEMRLECYVIGGFVRDIFLYRTSKDIDFLVVGSGIMLAEAVAKKLGKRSKLSVFKNFGTAQVK